MRCAEFGLNWSNDSREKDIYTQYKLHDKQVTSELTIKKTVFFLQFPDSKWWNYIFCGALFFAKTFLDDVVVNISLQKYFYCVMLPLKIVYVNFFIFKKIKWKLFNFTDFIITFRSCTEYIISSFRHVW